MTRTFGVGLVVCAALLVSLRATAHADCAPSCRAGYVCIDDACVSACNPAVRGGRAMLDRRRVSGRADAGA